MDTAKKIASRMIEDLPDEMVSDVIFYIEFIRSKAKNKVLEDMMGASLSSTNFWDNTIDDEVWNDA